MADMLFNSLVFLEFFFYTYLLYLAFRTNFKVQNLILLVASFIFYSYLEWVFSFLLIASILVDYFTGKRIYESASKITRRRLVCFSIVANLTILGTFKYFNFFISNISSLLQAIGLEPNFGTLQLILPIGISFYTFQSMSYSIDIYRGRIKPEKNFINFSLFVTFFPQLVAGPIERAENLLPQIRKKRVIKAEDINEGLCLILSGLFKKIVIADNLASIVDPIFNQPAVFSGFDYLIGILGFGIQIYCDFSGYSDMARGLARFLGFNLSLNFNLPYFAKNLKEFWSRWHITLSQWMRDYVYISLGGNKGSKNRTYVNLLLTMVVAGLWHGASWTFVFWGFLHSLYLIVFHSWESKSRSRKFHIPGFVAWLTTFLLVNLSWVFFRAASVDSALSMLAGLSFETSAWTTQNLTVFTICVFPLLLYQYKQFRSNDLLWLSRLGSLPQGVIYATAIFVIYLFRPFNQIQFIYFQF